MLEVWQRLEEVRMRSLDLSKREYKQQLDIDEQIRQIHRDLVLIAFCLQRLIAPLE